MTKTILCLANSKKLSGRCLAGYEIKILPDNSFEPLLFNEKLKWLRPISKESDGQIPTKWVKDILLFDIVTFDVLEDRPVGYQSENVLVDEKSIRRINRINDLNRQETLQSIVTLDYMHDRDFLSEDKTVHDMPNIFGNYRGDVNIEEIKKLNYSLMLLMAQSPKVKMGILNPGQHRISFKYHGHDYDLPITDPQFISNYHDNNSILDNLKYVYLTVSLGVIFNEKYYKLVAGVLL